MDFGLEMLLHGLQVNKVAPVIDIILNESLHQ